MESACQFSDFASQFLNQSVRVVLQRNPLSPLPIPFPLTQILQDTAVIRAHVCVWKDTERKACDFSQGISDPVGTGDSGCGSQSLGWSFTSSVCNCRQDFYHKPARTVSLGGNFTNVMENAKANELVVVNPGPRSGTFPYIRISGT